MNKTERIIKVILTLAQDPATSVPELAEQLQISERSVYRYLNVIKQLGYNLKKVQDEESGLRKHYLAPLTFTASEALAIIAAGQSLSSQDGLPINDDLKRALDKVKAAICPIEEKRAFYRLEPRFTYLGEKNRDYTPWRSLIQKLRDSEEMDPDKHDGTYELVRETIRAYSEMDDLSVCDYNDLNLVYLMTVGTWKHKVLSKKKIIDSSNLPGKSKEKLKDLLDLIWKRAQNKEYTNSDGSFGMFGTGFFSFKGKTDKDSPQKFIKACVDILDIEDDDQIFDRFEKVLDKKYHGMKAASASMVLHCLKPFTFPIFNSNMGSDNIYVYLGIDLDKKTEVHTYIRNCRQVKKYRDEKFNIRNYRIFDMAAWNIGKEHSQTDIDYIGVLDYLDNNRDVPYSNPEAQGVEDKEKQRLLEIKHKGQAAVAEMKKMVAICNERFGLDKCEPMSWLDGSNTKTRRYLWAQMKYGQYGENPISISIFVELSDETNKSRYRFSLEIKNDSSDKYQMKKYHSFLDLPVDTENSLVYVSGSNEFGATKVLSESVDEIKQKIADGVYKKVQLCRVQEWVDELWRRQAERDEAAKPSVKEETDKEEDNEEVKEPAE